MIWTGFTSYLFTGCSLFGVLLLPYGDSKSVGSLAFNRDLFWVHMRSGCAVSNNIGTTTGYGFLAVNGSTVASMKARVDADLAATAAAPSPTHILVNLGVNDVAGGLPAAAGWNADLAYILDAFHTKWPSVKVYVVKPWYRTCAADCDTVASRIDTVLSTRGAWAFVGHDERVWMKGADDGATMTHDGVHVTMAGAAECARQWRTILGL